MYEEKKTDPSGNVYEVEKVRGGGGEEREKERGSDKEGGKEREREIEISFINKCIFRRKRTCIIKSTTTVRQ